jgi:protein-tyrosine-phosphatase
MTEVLFVCIENSCRSQMAEAFAKIHGNGVVNAHSAGSRPSGVVHPSAVKSMGELGYDLGHHASKSLDEVPGECPFVPAKHREDWDIRDPKDLPPDEFREVRSEIEARVKALIVRAKG